MSGDEIIEKMMEIRESRNAEMKAWGISGNVLDVKTLIPAREDETSTNQKFLLIEENTLSNGEKVEVELFYDENGNKIGGNRSGDDYKDPFPIGGKELSLDLKKELIEFKEKIDLAEKSEEGLISIKELEEMRDMILKELELEGLDIKDLALIELKDLEISDEELKERLEKIEVEDLELEAQKELDESIDVEANLDDPEFEKKTKKEQLKQSDLSASAMIEGKTNINEHETIASALKVSDEGYVRFAVVQSSQLKDNPNSSKYTFVGIKKDGSAKILDSSILEAGMDYMEKENYEVTAKGDVNDNKGYKEYFRIKNSNYGFELGDNAGKLDVKLTSTGKGHGNDSVSVPVNTYGLEQNEKSVQELNEIDGANEKYKKDNQLDEIERHDSKTRKNTVEDIDGDIQTTGDLDWSTLVEELMEDEDVYAQFTSEEVKDMIDKYWADGNTESEIKYKIETDANNLENARNKDNH